MKLNLNSKEFVALYNNLHERFIYEQHNDTGVKRSDNVLLREVYNRMRACMIAALSGKPANGLEDLWFRDQEEKIKSLEQQNDSLRKAASAPVLQLDDVATPEGDDREYPKKSPQAPKPKQRGAR